MSRVFNRYAVCFIGIALSVILLKVLSDLAILPNKTLMAVAGILFLLNCGAVGLIYMKRPILSIFGFVLYGLIISGCLVGINYGNDTIRFFKNAFDNNKYELSTYNVVVLANSNYNKLEDLNDKSIGVLDVDNIDNITFYVSNINNVPYSDYIELYNGLENGLVDSILLESSYLDILSDDITDFDKKIRIIHSFDIKKEIEKDEVIDELKPLNIYISGSDSRSNKITNKSRSDVNMILTINPQTKTILMTSIPRDYYVQVHGQTGLKDKLTHAGIYGVDVSRQTLEDLFGIDIAYSVKIGMSAVVNVVDVIDGIDIESDTAFQSSHIKGWTVSRGINHMNGEQALAYSRERYAYSSGDRHRVLNQQQVLEAVLEKISNDKVILTRYDSFLTTLSDLYRTDIPESLIKKAIKDLLEDGSGYSFESSSVNGSDASLPTYTAPNTNRYVMIPFDQEVAAAKEKIENVLKGE